MYYVLYVQQYMNRELPDVQPGFRKGRGTRYQIANIHWNISRNFNNVNYVELSHKCFRYFE